MKNIAVIVIIFSLFSVVSCKSGKQTQVSVSAEPVEVTRQLLESISSLEKGLENLRFYFEEDLIITLDTTSGNGVWSVTEDGSVKLLSKKTITFPSKKYGKFLGEKNKSFLEQNKNFKVAFDDKPTVDAKLGTPELTMGFNESGKLRVISDLLVHKVDAVNFQNAIYLLPEGYQNIRVLVYQEGEGGNRSARGVKTPREEKAEKEKEKKKQ